MPAAQTATGLLQLQRLRGNAYVTRWINRIVDREPTASRPIQRRPLGGALTRPLASIAFSRASIERPELVPTRAVINGEVELTPWMGRSRKFPGFADRLPAVAQAWRNSDRVCAVVLDKDGKYHTIKTDFPGRGGATRLTITPFANEFSSVTWVNLPRVSDTANAATDRDVWSHSLQGILKWYETWSKGVVPPGFRCPHGERHGGRAASLVDVRRCLEAEFVSLLVEALGISTHEIHVVEPGAGDNAVALVNFDLGLKEEKVAKGGIARLPTDRTSAIPKPSITIGPYAFASRSQLAVIGTAIHESTHFEHASLGIEWLRRWRTSRSRLSFVNWLRDQKGRGRLSQEQLDLVVELTKVTDHGTQTLAYLDGFMATFHSMPIDETSTRFNPLDQSAQDWPLAGHAIHTSSMNRLARYYRTLDVEHQVDFAVHARKLRGARSGHNLFWTHIVRTVLGES